MLRLILVSLSCHRQQDWTHADQLELIVTVGRVHRLRERLSNSETWRIGREVDFENSAEIHLWELDDGRDNWWDADDYLGRLSVPANPTVATRDPWHRFTRRGAHYTLRYRVIRLPEAPVNRLFSERSEVGNCQTRCHESEEQRSRRNAGWAQFQYNYTPFHRRGESDDEILNLLSRWAYDSTSATEVLHNWRANTPSTPSRQHRGVPGAYFEIYPQNSERLYRRGQLNEHGFAHVGNLPSGVERFRFRFDGDPEGAGEIDFYNPRSHGCQASHHDGRPQLPNPGAGEGYDQTIENILIYLVAGDFVEDPTIEAVIARTVVGFVPVVGQLFDIEDIAGNLYLLIFNEPPKYDDFWVWLALVLTIIGIIPWAGDVVKGVGTILARAGRSGGIARNIGRIVDEIVQFINLKFTTNWVQLLNARLSEFHRLGAEVRRILNMHLDYLLRILQTASEYGTDIIRRQARDYINRIRYVKRVMQGSIDEAIQWIEQNMRFILDERGSMYLEGLIGELNHVDQPVEELFRQLTEEMALTAASASQAFRFSGRWSSAQSTAYKMMFGVNSLPFNSREEVLVSVHHIVEKALGGGAHSADNLFPIIHAWHTRISGVYSMSVQKIIDENWTGALTSVDEMEFRGFSRLFGKRLTLFIKDSNSSRSPLFRHFIASLPPDEQRQIGMFIMQMTHRAEEEAMMLQLMRRLVEFREIITP